MRAPRSSVPGWRRDKAALAVVVVFTTLLVAACGGADVGASGENPASPTTSEPTASDPTASEPVTPDPTGDATADASTDGAGGAPFPTSLDGDVDLTPLTLGDDAHFPLGPAPVLVLGLGDAVEVSPTDAEEYFGGASGGAARAYDVTLGIGEAVLEAGILTVPETIPPALLEANAGRTHVVLDALEIEDVAFVPAGTPAQEFCRASDTGDVVGGWRYDGSPGDLQLSLTIDIGDDAALAGLGLVGEWSGTWERELFEGVDVATYADHCLDDSGRLQWGWGTALREEG